MPIYRVIVKEEITRRRVAYVSAPDWRAADNWAADAPDDRFKPYAPDLFYGSAETITRVDEAPEGHVVWRANDNR